MTPQCGIRVALRIPAVLVFLALVGCGGLSVSNDQPVAESTDGSPPATTRPGLPTTSGTTTAVTDPPMDEAAPLCGRSDTLVAGSVENPELDEASGLAASRDHAGVFWTHNDGSDNRLFALGEDGEDLGVHELQIDDLVDVEDIAALDGPSGSELLLADIGDNDRERSSVRVIRFAEPDPFEPGPISDVQVLEYVYPDAAHNAETLLADAISNTVVIVTKEQSANSVGPAELGHTEPAFVFEGSLDPAADGPVELALVGTVDMPTLESRTELSPSHPLAIFGAAGVATAGDIAADGTMIALRTYESVWLWQRGANQTVVEALTSEPCEVGAAFEQQGEAVAFDGDGLATLGEGVRQPINRLGK